MLLKHVSKPSIIKVYSVSEGYVIILSNFLISNKDKKYCFKIKLNV